MNTGWPRPPPRNLLQTRARGGKGSLFWLGGAALLWSEKPALDGIPSPSAPGTAVYEKEHNAQGGGGVAMLERATDLRRPGRPPAGPSCSARDPKQLRM